MQYKKIVYIFQFIIPNFSIVSAILGQSVRSIGENEFPSVGCLLRYNPEQTFQQNLLCTGTFISNNFLLTAAHCFNEENQFRFEVSVGSHLVEMGEKYYPIWWITYDQWAVRNLRNFVQEYHDVLLVKIFGIWRDIRVSQLGAITPTNLMLGLNPIIIGCGKLNNGTFPEIIQTAIVQIISRENCGEIISQLQGSQLSVPEKYSCSVANPYVQLDNGDSGGPLLYFGLVIGINVATCPKLNDEFHPNKVNVHVNIEGYMGFLNSFTRRDK